MLPIRFTKTKDFPLGRIKFLGTAEAESSDLLDPKDLEIYMIEVWGSASILGVVFALEEDVCLSEAEKMETYYKTRKGTVVRNPCRIVLCDWIASEYDDNYVNDVLNGLSENDLFSDYLI